MVATPTLAIGHVVLVKFPFSDGATVKRRPALVVSAPDRYGDHLMVPITSNPSAHDAIPLSAADLQEGKLMAESWIKPLKANPVEARAVDKVIGKVKPQVLEAVRAALCPALGCVGGGQPC